ncbi:DUF29 domain-containing protein [Desulfatirhabdium butyrativorans]|uniref:DUF29 domain-containing protein n=1 Tax=Desulfatirhabdium butyrativorans TaxID=340467 RepID=UPI00047FDD12|nr:DUF29 domain-containing protein [Desulfatirhabdium butyrativorans]
MSNLYDQDFYQWTIEQATLLRAGALSQLDIENLIEEVESMGKSQKKELFSRIAVLLMHLLKWDYQAEQRSGSWKSTILTQRRELKFLLLDNPSLNRIIPDAVISVYSDSRLSAAAETGLPESAFPETCPYTIEQIMGE